MNMVVCVKQVIDPEAPPASFKIDAATNKAVLAGVPPVIDPFDGASGEVRGRSTFREPGRRRRQVVQYPVDPGPLGRGRIRGVRIIDDEDQAAGPIRNIGPDQRWRTVAPLARILDRDLLVVPEGR